MSARNTRIATTAAMAALMGASLVHADPSDGLMRDDFDDDLTDPTRNVELDVPGAGARLLGRLYIPAPHLRNGAAVVAMHGCNGLWSNGVPRTIAQAAIEKWGRQLAASGYFALAVDSYTARTPPDVDVSAFQTQCAKTTYAGAVDPYKTRVEDLDKGISWLHYRLGARVSGRIGALGWSQGAEAVLVRAAETSRGEDATLYPLPQDETSALPAAVAFYPGCGPALGFVQNWDLAQSFWRPHHDLRINHAGADALEPNCATRASIAQHSYDTSEGSGHWLQYTTYAGAQHSFDGTVHTWPTEPCNGQAQTDICAATDADLDSFSFLDERLRSAP